MSETEPESTALPDGVLTLSILLSGGVGAGISALAVNERMIEIYRSMGVELPGLLRLAMDLNAPVVCGVGGSLAAFLVYLVASRRITSPTPARVVRVGATALACLLLLFAVGTRESMQASMEGLREALSQGGPELPAPVPGEAQDLVREVVKGVEQGLASAKDGKWSFRGPGGAVRQLALPQGQGGEGVSFPSAERARAWSEVQAAASASGAELGYAFSLWRAEGELYRLRIAVFRGPPSAHQRAEAQFETVLQ